MALMMPVYANLATRSAALSFSVMGGMILAVGLLFGSSIQEHIHGVEHFEQAQGDLLE
jgi:hypothetical protein